MTDKPEWLPGGLLILACVLFFIATFTELTQTIILLTLATVCVVLAAWNMRRRKSKKPDSI